MSPGLTRQFTPVNIAALPAAIYHAHLTFNGQVEITFFEVCSLEKDVPQFDDLLFRNNRDNSGGLSPAGIVRSALKVKHRPPERLIRA